MPRPRPLYPQERPGTLCVGGWVGPRAGLEGYKKSGLQPAFDPRTVQHVASRHTDLKNSYMFRCLNASTSGGSFVTPKLHAG